MTKKSITKEQLVDLRTIITTLDPGSDLFESLQYVTDHLETFKFFLLGSALVINYEEKGVEGAADFYYRKEEGSWWIHHNTDDISNLVEAATNWTNFIEIPHNEAVIFLNHLHNLR